MEEARDAARDVQPVGISEPHWKKKKKSCLGPHTKALRYVIIHKNLIMF